MRYVRQTPASCVRGPGTKKNMSHAVQAAMDDSDDSPHLTYASWLKVLKIGWRRLRRVNASSRIVLGVYF